MTSRDWASLGLLLGGLLLQPLGVRAQCIFSQRDAGPPSAVENADTAEVAPYCQGLRRVAALAGGKGRFASIAGKPREGDFLDTTLVLANWSACALYGVGTYTCDSPELASAREAEQAQANLLQKTTACLGDTWTEAKHRSSANYVVLHHAVLPISITLSTDETNARQYIVRLIVFVRRN